MGNGQFPWTIPLGHFTLFSSVRDRDRVSRIKVRVSRVSIRVTVRVRVRFMVWDFGLGGKFSGGEMSDTRNCSTFLHCRSEVLPHAL